jgi:GT2 family glycosyltransferase
MAAVIYAESPDVVQYVGAAPHFMGTQTLLDSEISVTQLKDAVRAVGTAITCCVMVDRARYPGGRWFDEHFFLYLEDHEFGLRAALQGYDCIVVPEARCLHHAGTIGVSIRQTGRFTPIRVRHTIRNRWLTMLMLYQPVTLLRFAPALPAYEVLQLHGAQRKGWFGHWLWAAGSTARLLPHVLSVRRDLRTRRRRKDVEILTGGPFPFNPRWRHSRLERAARRSLDLLAGLNWRLAGRRGS